MTQEEMYRKILQFDEEIQKRKTKRCIKFFLGVALVFFIIFISWFKESILESLVLALIISGIYLFTGALIWQPFIHANDVENKQLEDMKKEYQQTYNQTWF